MTEAKTYRATDRGYYRTTAGGYALAEESETFTTTSPQGSWMEEVDVAPVVDADTGPDYGSLKLPELTRMAVERGIKPDPELKGVQLKKQLVEALEAAD